MSMSDDTRRKCNGHRIKGMVIADYPYSYEYSSRGYRYCVDCKKQCDKADKKLGRMFANNEKQRIEKHRRWEQQSAKKYSKRNPERDLWDFIVRDELTKGISLKGPLKYKYRTSIPTEVLQFKRALIRLQRMIASQKEIFFKMNQEKKEEAIRLKAPLVKCGKHGDLFINGVIKNYKKAKGDYSYKCKACRKDVSQNYYKNNKDYVLTKAAEWRKKNPDRVKQIRVNYWERMNDKNNEHEDVER